MASNGSDREAQDEGGPIHPLPASPVEPQPEHKRSETTRRVLTAAVLVPLVLYVIYLGGLAYFGMVLAFTLLGLSEFYRLIEDKGAQPLVGLGLALGAGVTAVAYVGTEYHTNLLLAASLVVLMVAQLRKAHISESLASLSGTFFGVYYVAWLLSHAVGLRFFYERAETRYDLPELVSAGISPECGIFLIVYTLTVVVNCDAGAYFVGRAYGRRKLAPRISPGKSVEGALGGIIVGTLMGMLFKGIFDVFWPDLSEGLPWAATIPAGILISIAGITGDLVESMLKRDAAVKDTGALLPGMGGILDRIDAALLGIPVMYYLMLGYVHFVLRVSPMSGLR